ncbi:diacylglycerol/lipid kinase family protein [Limnohabitans sp.]|uniref:diacylglycerol/lipid kinase family protein n=1 Tax=Limnohabitans sp. TaxID=1907725 RepID=UPI002AFF7D03|nr:diacylglycerol kinase family protein [Limnohabitans sp.]
MALVLLNPHAQGGRAARRIPTLRAWLAAHAPNAQLAAPEALSDSVALLESLAEGSRVVVVGGDGTLNCWLPMLLARRLTIGLVPMGSGNDSARAWGVDGLPWAQALTLALQGPAQAIDTGLAHWCDMQGQTHDTPFLSSLTAGFDSAVGLRALNGPSWLRGLPRYLWATLNELIHLRHWDLTLHSDGHLKQQGACLFASSLNTPTFGSGMPAVPHAQLADGQLNALLAGTFGRPGALLMLPRLLIGRHLGHPRIGCWAYRQLDIACTQGVPLAADGEYLGEAQHVRIHCQAASLLVVRR